MSWCTIESDPGVFTSLIEDIGVKNVQVEELYSLDENDFRELAPVYGLIFLFKWEPQHAQEQHDNLNMVDDHQVPENLFFAKQVITNACATQAILSILLNSNKDIEIGDTLTEFKSFTSDFPPDLKGLAISNSDKIRTAHNSFSRAEPFVMEESRVATENDDVYHFIAYLPFQGYVYELDGLKEGPICLGRIPLPNSGSSSSADSWLSVATPLISKRIEKYSQTEIRFNLLALVKNRIQMSQQTLAELMEQEQTESVLAMINHLQKTIATEEKKRKNWKVENERRKHNYIPFIIELLKIMAKKGQLSPAIQAQVAKYQTNKK